MSALAAPAPGMPPDPREFRRLPVGDLRIDQRKQREVDPEKVAKIANEWDWERCEAITVAPGRDKGTWDVVEGQHRTLGALQWGGVDVLMPCMVVGPRTDKEQSEIALGIVQGRRPHSAYEQWRQRYNAGHAHEVFATSVLESFGMRVGKAPSAMTIAAVATVRRIVHGGGFSPEIGAELLRGTLTVLHDAFPTHDHESNVSRWDRSMLLAVAGVIVAYPDVDTRRLASALRIRPAGQWVNLGKGGGSLPPDQAIRAIVLSEYNRGRRTGRLQ